MSKSSYVLFPKYPELGEQVNNNKKKFIFSMPMVRVRVSLKNE